MTRRDEPIKPMTSANGNAPQRRATPGPTSIGGGKGGAEPSAALE